MKIGLYWGSFCGKRKNFVELCNPCSLVASLDERNTRVLDDKFSSLYSFWALVQHKGLLVVYKLHKVISL